MTLSNQRLTIVADTVVDDAKIATYGAILNLETNHLSFTARNLDEAACKTFRELVRSNRAEFEDFAYAIQEAVGVIKGHVEDTNAEA